MLKYKLFRTNTAYASLPGGGEDTILEEGEDTLNNIRSKVNLLKKVGAMSRSKIERESVHYWAATVEKNGGTGPLIN